MGETANTIPPKGLFSIKGSDWVKGIGIVLFGNITVMILFLIEQDHWPSWVEWQPYIKMTVSTLLGYIGKNFFTNNTGQLFTADKPTTTVPTKELDKVIDKAETK